MNENVQSKRRDWVKNAAIIFLTIMLILTFFSNTIMNYSLPEVATQYVQPGTITAKVRGTGTVEATDPYNVMTYESRVIASVAVKQGDIVEKDQVLYYLEDKESEELKAAEEELEALELAYMKGLFGSNVSPEVISKVASGNTGNFASYQEMVTDMQNRLQAAQDRVKECQDALDAITLQSTLNSNNAGVSTNEEELKQEQATTDLAKAQEAFEADKAAQIAKLNAEIGELEKRIADLEKLVSGAEDTAGSVGGDSTTPSGIDVYTQQRDNALKVVYEKVLAIKTAAEGGGLIGTGTITISANSTIDELTSAYAQLKSAIGEKSEYASMYSEYEAALAQYKIAADNYNNAAGQLTGYEKNVAALKKAQKKLSSLQAKLAEVNAITVSSSGSVQDAQNRLLQAQKNIAEITSANEQAASAYQNQIANATAALENAQAVYELLKTEQSELTADINAELDLSKTSRDIANKKEEIEQLKAKSMGAAITAPVAGKVTKLAYVAGETTNTEQAAAVIQVEGKGFTVSFSVTNVQAQKVKVGDVAELQNAWYYDDITATLATIKPDPESAGQKKLLVFEVSGNSVEEGQSLSLSVGQRSSDYELVVPNSTIREDNNGKFILIVESKSSPLGNRYIATRVDVEVLASDDNYTAISAGLYGYEYVITTATKPVEAGKQVRLNEGS